jgi:hypothetical protein
VDTGLSLSWSIGGIDSRTSRARSSPRLEAERHRRHTVVILSRAVRGAQHDDMRSRRFIALLVVAVVALVAIVAASQSGCGGGTDMASPSQPPVNGVPATPQASGDPAASSGAPAAPAAEPTTGVAGSGDALAAVQTLKRFCDLVDDGRLHAASKLLAGPWVWPRRELLPIARLRLASARVQQERLSGDVVLLARIRARLRGPSTLHDGVNTLFFTLGRDGTTGGWLITAVTSSP